MGTQGFHFDHAFHVLLCLHICMRVHKHTIFRSSKNIYQYQRLANLEEECDLFHWTGL